MHIRLHQRSIFPEKLTKLATNNKNYTKTYPITSKQVIGVKIKPKPVRTAHMYMHVIIQYTTVLSSVVL